MHKLSTLALLIQRGQTGAHLETEKGNFDKIFTLLRIQGMARGAHAMSAVPVVVACVSESVLAFVISGPEILRIIAVRGVHLCAGTVLRPCADGQVRISMLSYVSEKTMNPQGQKRPRDEGSVNVSCMSRGAGDHSWTNRGWANPNLRARTEEMSQARDRPSAPCCRTPGALRRLSP